MTATQFRAALDRLGMTQQSFAAYAGVNDRTVRRYVLGETAIPGPIESLIMTLLNNKP
jgi:DNA-binding transcriptional regulator YiaG